MPGGDPAQPLERLHPDGWPRPGGYSNGYRVPAGRDLVFVAGMVGWDETETIVPGGFAAQFEQVLRNIVAVVETAGGTPADVVSMTVFVVDRSEYLGCLPELGAAGKRVMGRHYPAMALLEISGLVEDGARLEIQSVAALAPAS